MSPAVPTEAAGCAIPSHLPERWLGWFAPSALPFDVSSLSAEDRRALPEPEVREVPLAIKDVFWLYGDQSRVWLTEPQFRALGRGLQERLARAQRHVHEAWGRDARGRAHLWWPSVLAAAPSRTGGPLGVVVRLIEAGVPASRHADVAEETWRRCEPVLQRARELAGTFAEDSGPNCFGTVMGAAGVAGAEDEWMHPGPFDEWLASTGAAEVRGTGHDREPGVVLVWRSTADGTAWHAAVTVGDGWTLDKPSQAWLSPRLVRTVRDSVLHGRRPGARLHRYALPH